MDRIRARAAHRFSWRPQVFGQFILPTARLPSMPPSNDVEMKDVELEDAVMTSMTSVSDVEMEDVSNQPPVALDAKTTPLLSPVRYAGSKQKRDPGHLSLISATSPRRTQIFRLGW
ncbi:hypothetical protein MRX96_022365 [Rhipicephalus microplus]